MKRVVVGLSGGVDSSVAAYLLKEQGYDVIGMFMRNWHDETVVINNECPWVDDSNDAMLVAEKLGIPFQVIDLSEEYKERIVNYMFSEYEQGRTPNPDVLCNREIKFDVFLKAAIGLKADYVATGHYCQKATSTENGKEIHHLLSGADKGKDQSYFLCQLNQEQLSKALFPIGHLQKSEVRDIARREELVTAEKKDSQGLCFVGKVRLPEFLQQQLMPKEGRIIEVPADHPIFKQKLALAHGEESYSDCHSWKLKPTDGYVVGKHKGAHYYTIGQRKGLAVGGTTEPLFIIGTDTKENIVYVGKGEKHPGLWRKSLFVALADVHWIREDLKMAVGEKRNYMVRIRYRQALVAAVLDMQPEGLYIEFENEMSAITPGQFAAWYDGQELLGSGVIAE
jgi:tRNA-uridine 2-sulfurtransferase